MMSSPLFGALILDREPYTFGDLPGLAQAWCQDAGGFFYVGLLFYFLVFLFRPQATPQDEKNKKLLGLLMLGSVAISTILYAVYIFLVFLSIEKGPGGLGGPGADLLNVKPPQDPTGYTPPMNPKFSLLGYTDTELPKWVGPWNRGRQPYPWQALLLTVGGLISFIGASAPFFLSLSKLRFGRIWAIMVLSMKEVVRNWVFLAFLVVLIPLLFPINWFIPPKPGSELRDAVKWIAPLTAAFLILACKLLSSFALPNDVKNQNIFTIVTKPVERFEIVLGRFFGYLTLFTGVVVAVAVVTLITIVTSSPSEKSQAETGTARVPVRGQLTFQSRKGTSEGVDVGREFNYRKYIGGAEVSSQRAVYSFRNLPTSLQRKDKVPVEYNFDIYRLTKGEENRGVDINIRAVSWQCPQEQPGLDDASGEWKWKNAETEKRYRADALAEVKKVPAFSGLDREESAVQALASATPDSPLWPAANELARKYGYFEFRGREIYDFQPDRLQVPSALFESAFATKTKGDDGKEVSIEKNQPKLTIYIHCTSNSQMLGMAEADLYVLESEQYFAVNYLKSAFGLWCWLALVIGICVTLSTYLDAIVTLMAAAFLFVTPFFAGFVFEMVQSGGTQGGSAGPFTALTQLLQAKQPTAQAEGTAIEKLSGNLDIGSGWGFRRVLNVLPDVMAFNWTDHVAEGFDVSPENLAMNFIVLVAYLFPWFLLSYFLIRGREMAA